MRASPPSVDLASERAPDFTYSPVEPGLVRDIAERLLAAAALILLSPVMLLTALIIRLDSPGPALFTQHRVGAGGELFRFTKFRTFYSDAKLRYPELYNYDLSEERIRHGLFKEPDDPRVTRVGRWLRRSTLDELPNLWHVLSGKMALVGPRPEIPELLPYCTREELSIFSVRPGVTGLAQISGRGLLTFAETCHYNLEYLRTRSFLVDVKILALTVQRVLLGHGAF